MKSYAFPIEIEESDGRWCASVPLLEHCGATTWGMTKEEVLRKIQEVAPMVIECLIEDGIPLPDSIASSEHPAIAVNV